MDWFDRILAWLDEPNAASTRARSHTFELILILLSVTELWLHEFLVQRQIGGAFSFPLPVFVTLCGVAAYVPSWRQLGFLFLAVGLAVAVYTEFPSTGNHLYLECVLCALCALLDPSRREEERLLTRAVRWMACVILFFAGIQKLVHGYYTSGLMPAFLLREPRFEPVFALLLPSAEAQRILSYNGLDGSGPYFVSTPLWLLASNVMWMTEIALALALSFARTRQAAVFVGIAFVALIEIGAREILFGLLFVNLLLMFLRSAANRRFVPIVVLTCVIVLAIQLGWLPDMEMH